MGIKEEIDKLTESVLLPNAPAEAIPVVPVAPAKDKILAVVERLVKPWKYGVHYQRFAEEVGVTLDQVKEIADAVSARKAVLTPVAEPVAETVEK